MTRGEILNNSKLDVARGRQWPAVLLALAVAAAVAGCGKKDAPPGQSLVRVNGSEITALQLNDELQRANVPPAQQDAARKQLVQSLVDRQLLLNAAENAKLDRDPKIVQAIERAKAMIIAQAYMQKTIGMPQKPSKQEMQDYYQKNPVFFAQRKQFLLHQLAVQNKDFGADASKAVDGAKSLDEVAAWFDAHQVAYKRGDIQRSSADLPPEFSKRLAELPKGKLFIVHESGNTILSVIADIRDTPAEFDAVAPQIEQYLINVRAKDAGQAEMARLRAAAKIEYLNKSVDPGVAAAPAAPAPAVKADDSTARGLSGLK